MADSLTLELVRAGVLAALLGGVFPANAEPPREQGERHVGSSAELRQSVSMSGTVLGPSGALVPGASVHVRGQHGDIQQSTQADAVGEFRFSGLPEGRYEIRVEQTGFKPYETRLRLHGQSARQLRIVLAIANLEEKIRGNSSEWRLSTEAGENKDASQLDSSILESFPILDQHVIFSLSHLLGQPSLRLA